MIFGQNFYNITELSAEEIELLLQWLQKNRVNGKLESNLPLNTINEITKLKDELKKYVLLENFNIYKKELSDDLKVIDGGEYGDSMSFDEEEPELPDGGDDWEW